MDADKIKEFFIHHFEKMVLVLVIGASAFLIYKGWELPNFLDQHQPDRLSADATQVKSDIDINHNDAIIPPRQPTFDIVERVTELYTAVDPSAYKLERTWRGDEPESVVRRQDPLLVRPHSLIAQGVITAIAIRGNTSDPDNYLLASLEDADPVEKVEAPVIRERRPRRRRGGGGMGGDMGDMMDDMMEEMDDEMFDMGEMDMDMGESMGGGSGRRFNSDFDFGVRPQATDDKKYPKPAIGWFIAGAAVVPHKQLYEAYELALRDAAKYDPRRDTPVYFNLEVQRADVTDKPVDQLVDQDWGKIWDRTLYTKLGAKYWSGFAPEIVPADYRDDALTMWIPPVLLDDYSTFAKHPLVPMIPQEEVKAMLNPMEEEDVPDFTVDDLTSTETVLRAPGAQPGAGTGMDGMMGMGMDDMMDMEDMGTMGGMMGGMGAAMFGRGMIEEDPVDYKLIRFYDFVIPNFAASPKYGRQYVYRLRYAIVDPNFPYAQSLQPKANTLSPDVAKRVKELRAKALATGTRSFQLWSEWSEPSAPASLPSLEHVFAGPVTRGSINSWKVGNRSVEYSRDQPSAKIVASQYDVSTGARVPIRMDVTEGSVLSHTAEFADVVDPISLKVKKMPDVELVSGTTIVDLDGGVPLKITKGLTDAELTEPGLMLLFDQTGQLKVGGEVGDQEFYRIYSYADERGEP